MKKTILFLLISIASFGQASFDEGLELPKSSNTSFIYMKPIRNNLGGFYNQQFFESDQGYSIFRPSLANLPARFYIMPNGTPTGTTSKFEMFNTDYSADWTIYSAFNILMNNTTNTISIGSNRGSGGGTRQKLRIGGDFVGSSFTANASAIDFNTDNTININPFNGAVGFGTTNTDPYSLAIENQYTFRNPATGQPTRVNINGNGNSAGALYFGRDNARIVNLGLSGATNVFDISINKTNSGNTLTTYVKIIGNNGNLMLADGGSFTDNGIDRFQIAGSAIATAWKTAGGASTDYVTGTGSLINFNSGVRTATLTGYVSGAGVVSASDNVLQAIQKLNGNIADAASSGTYTPTFVAGSNATSVVLFKSATWSRNGSIVTVRADFTCNFSTSNTTTSFTMSLPFNRNSSTNMLMGSGSAGVNVAGNNVLSIICQSVNTDRVNINTLPIGGSAFSGSVVLQYSVLD